MEHQVGQVVANAIANLTSHSLDQVQRLIRRPPNAEMGHYAFACFEYGRTHGFTPNLAANYLASNLNVNPAFTRIAVASAAGPFLNIQVKAGLLAASVLEAVASKEMGYGSSEEGHGRTIVIDYSAPNIAKPFHVGHLMSTVIGASLGRIYERLGYKVVRINHLGDWGVQCGFQFLAWEEQKKKGKDPDRELELRGLDYLAELYVDINNRAKSDAGELDKEARRLFKQLEDGDARLKALWQKFRQATLSNLQKSYDRLGVKFDSNDGEGFYEPLLKPMLDQLKASGIAIESDGALVIPMDDAPRRAGKNPVPPFILRKSDDATIYGTRDLAAALFRMDHYGFDKCLYIVDVRQSGHFNMLFKSLAKMGKSWSKNCVHVSFGLMQIKDGDEVRAMTTRGGQMVPLNELLDTMRDKVRGIIQEKNEGLKDADVVAEMVGIGAIVFWIQSRRRDTNFVFDWAQATDSTGDSGPYLQYSYVRAKSILLKSQRGAGEYSKSDFKLLVEPEEATVAKAIDEFPNAVKTAAAAFEPSYIAANLLDIAAAFGVFLNKHRILDSEPAVRGARLALVHAVALVLTSGLELLGIDVPEEM